ncbi:signal peptidase II [Patescibacteria group bacterium]|nr:MAG: signal peptidase II [Patescibacteria group bacterium]
MMRKTMFPIAGFLAAALLFAADRGLKWYATHSLPPEGVFWIPRFLGLERYQNRGLAFGLPANQLLILLASLVVAVYLVKKIMAAGRSPRAFTALAFLLLGAGSNFFDRLYFGYVIDYLRVGPLSLVNIADGMVLAGLLLAFWGGPKRI